MDNYIWIQIDKATGETQSVRDGGSLQGGQTLSRKKEKHNNRKQDIKHPGDKTADASNTITGIDQKQIFFKAGSLRRTKSKRGRRDVTCCYRDARTGEEWCW